jgi:hypothetical protein
MIHPDTGAIALGGAVLTGRMPLRHLLRSALGDALREGPKYPPFEWYYLKDVAVADEPWSVSLCFRQGLLESVNLSPRTPYGSWSDYSEAHERATATRLRGLLGQWLLCAPSKQVAGMDIYCLSWGMASAGFVPQDATASIGVRYAEGVEG